ncbi:MAG: M20 family metallopeptidase [Alphaproteobacteria bacterium]|nr:M20 family metallopeptidase [Alphaproteobacteria bacterium]
MNDTTRSNIPVLDAEEILAGIRRWVEMESPSHDAVAVNRLVDMVETDLRRIGAKLTRTPGRDGFGDVLEAHSPWGREDEKGILILGHLDTVHPIGALATTHRFRKEGDKVFGPGIYDMKAGSFMGYYALQHFVRTGRTTPLPVRIMYIPEEEVGSPTSRELIEKAALKAKYVLVMEPAREGNKCVTARKGVGRFEMRITGKAAHSGARHEDGRSAIKEAARQILAIEGLTDYAKGITTNVGLIKGGSGVNVVPALCELEIDLRVPTAELAESVTAHILGLKSHDPDCTVEVTGGMNRPPYGKNEGIAKLFEHAKGLAKEIGFDLQDVPLTGGGSDGNFTAAMGIPTLDGLGADGRGPHALDEQIYYSSLVPHAQLLVRLLETLR